MAGAKSGNAALHFVDRNAAEGRGDVAAFREAPGGREITYSALAEQTDRMADFYRRHGLRREDRVAMLVLDQIEFPIIFWGSLKAGVVPVAINTLLSTEIYDAVLRDSRARALFVSETLLPVVEPLLETSTDLEKVFVVGGAAPAEKAEARGGSVLGALFGRGERAPAPAPSGRLSFAAELAESARSEAVAVSPDEIAFWLYSSGSTGQPKGVRHVHGSLKATAETYGAQVLGVRPDDVVYSVAKLFFAYGLGNAMTFPMSVGATAVLFAGRPTPDVVTDIIANQGVTIFCGVPTLYAAALAHIEKQGAAPSGPLRRCISAGEALPEGIGKRWRAHWGVDILDGVGSTEMLHIFLSNAPEDVVYGTSGRAVPGYDLLLVDEADNAVAPGEIGELLVRGASAADGYWNQREKSRATFLGEWTRTGDKYERTEDGRYIYCGRTDDMFKVSGIWVSPFEVEQALISHPAVLEAAVVAARDDDGLEKPKAFIVLKDAAAMAPVDELKEHVKSKIGMWKHPRWIEVAAELPKTATGKIQRFKLRDQA